MKTALRHDIGNSASLSEMYSKLLLFFFPSRNMPGFTEPLNDISYNWISWIYLTVSMDKFVLYECGKGLTFGVLSSFSSFFLVFPFAILPFNPKRIQHVFFFKRYTLKVSNTLITIIYNLILVFGHCVFYHNFVRAFFAKTNTCICIRKFQIETLSLSHCGLRNGKKWM